MTTKAQDKAQEIADARTLKIDPTFFTMGIVQILLRKGSTGTLVKSKSRKLMGDRAVRVVVREANAGKGVEAQYIDAIIPKEIGAEVEKAIEKRKVNKISASVVGVHRAKTNTTIDVGTGESTVYLNETLHIKRLTVLPDYAPCGDFGLTTFIVTRALEDGRMKVVKGRAKGAFNGMRRYRAVNDAGEWNDEEMRIAVFDRLYGRETFIPKVVKSGRNVCVKGVLSYRLNPRTQGGIDAVMSSDEVSYSARPRIFGVAEVVGDPRIQQYRDGNVSAYVPIRPIWELNALNHKTGETYTDSTPALYVVESGRYRNAKDGKRAVEAFKDKVTRGGLLLLQDASFEVSPRYNSDNGLRRVVRGKRWQAISNGEVAGAGSVIYSMGKASDVHHEETKDGVPYSGVTVVSHTYNRRTKEQDAKFVQARVFGDAARNVAEHVGKGSDVAVIGKYRDETPFETAKGEKVVNTGMVLDRMIFLSRSAGRPMLADDAQSEPEMDMAMAAD